MYVLSIFQVYGRFIMRGGLRLFNIVRFVYSGQILQVSDAQFLIFHLNRENMFVITAIRPSIKEIC